jgi:hypothetical protein
MYNLDGRVLYQCILISRMKKKINELIKSTVTVFHILVTYSYFVKCYFSVLCRVVTLLAHCYLNRHANIKFVCHADCMFLSGMCLTTPCLGSMMPTTKSERISSIWPSSKVDNNGLRMQANVSTSV